MWWYRCATRSNFDPVIFQGHPVTFVVHILACLLHNYQSILILNGEEDVIVKMCNTINCDPMTVQGYRILFSAILWPLQFNPCPTYCSVPNFQSLFILMWLIGHMVYMCNTMKFWPYDLWRSSCDLQRSNLVFEFSDVSQHIHHNPYTT